jgi:hypothetical protein
MNPEEKSTSQAPNASTGWVPAIVLEGLRRCSEQRVTAMELPRRSNADWAARADRLAELCDREARWWSVLATWTYRQGDVPLIYRRAVLESVIDKRNRALSWRESAADWRRRAAGEPVCEVIGCGCAGSGDCRVAV